MKTEHDRLRQLVLILEDLEGEDLRVARAHLDGCDACRRLRERVLAVESVVRCVPALPPADDPLDGLSAIERAQAGDSRVVLQKRTGRRVGGRLDLLLPVALAAVLVGAVLLPLQRRGEGVVDLQVGSPLVLRGSAGQAAAAEHGLSFRLRRDGYPVLVHVDGAGGARLLHPAAGADLGLLAADQLTLLPAPERGDAWRRELAPGCETYLLGIADADAPPGAEQIAALTLLPAGADRRQAVDLIRKHLAEICRSVSRRDGPGCD